MKNEIEIFSEKIFEDIKHLDENSNEFWYARELQQILDYKEWRKFEGIIKKAKIACINSGYDSNDYFVHADKIVKTGAFDRIIDDFKLSRYACYLIAQNGDSRKEVIALAQTYFATQTRKQEILEAQYNLLSEDEKRLFVRNKVKDKNLSLNNVAKKAGVKNFGKFHDSGYKGLYNGETANDIAKRKGLEYNQEILDYMGSEELADNLFRITQTEAKMKRDKIQGEGKANETHYNMGKAIREFIADQGGTMPEELPTPNKSIKQIERETNLKIKEKNDNQ